MFSIIHTCLHGMYHVATRIASTMFRLYFFCGKHYLLHAMLLSMLASCGQTGRLYLPEHGHYPKNTPPPIFLLSGNTPDVSQDSNVPNTGQKIHNVEKNESKMPVFDKETNVDIHTQ